MFSLSSFHVVLSHLFFLRLLIMGTTGDSRSCHTEPQQPLDLIKAALSSERLKTLAGYLKITLRVDTGTITSPAVGHESPPPPDAEAELKPCSLGQWPLNINISLHSATKAATQIKVKLDEGKTSLLVLRVIRVPC